ncbi:hypothetical protein AZG88_43545 [Rhodococcus sp. LB1]|nr:hypothetical protein AZG88_43545 [Rhodococcus sp. LB1]
MVEICLTGHVSRALYSGHTDQSEWDARVAACDGLATFLVDKTRECTQLSHRLDPVRPQSPGCTTAIH